MNKKKSPLALAMFKSKHQPTALSHERPFERIPIAKLYEQYERIQLESGKSEKAARETRFCVALLQEVTGATYLDEIDYECALNFKRALSVYPKNRKRIPELANTEGFEAIYLGFELGKETLSTARCLKIIQGNSSFMEFGVKMSQVNQNVFSKLMTKREVVSNRRHSFDDDHLNLIYNMDEYLEHRYLHPYYYWVPLMLRFTGTRLNEVCGLFATDIVHIDSIPCIVINEGMEGQRIKNNNSVRLIPIHSELIRLGFMDFVESRCGGRLFPELPLVNGYYSHNASKWFARRRSQLGLGKGLDCYSFRHRFITELRENDTSFPTIMSIAGHVTSTEEKRLGDWYKSPTHQAYSHSLHPSVTQLHTAQASTKAPLSTQ
ncbi:Phage integrase family protein [Vibrio thalassae]|uniref:Phage integrase family protein n=1 Tax=Vibrio thalassae TaxID=1243014 RepID=A0A240ENT4_9VIBR|nr:site-specific integrase [Vibrio thalassae]SNX50362.1 Phage integrase family protein [Vibrio thalassae]